MFGSWLCANSINAGPSSSARGEYAASSLTVANFSFHGQHSWNVVQQETVLAWFPRPDREVRRRLPRLSVDG